MHSVVSSRQFHFIYIIPFGRNENDPLVQLMQNIGALIGPGTLARDLGGITIWNPWSNGN